MKKVLSDEYIIKNGFRIDLANDGEFILKDKNFSFYLPNVIVLKGKYNWYFANVKKSVYAVLFAYTDNNHSKDEPADDILSDGWQDYYIYTR